MLEKGREPNTVIGNMRFFANHKDIELSSFCVLRDDLLTGHPQQSVHFPLPFFVDPVSTYMNEMATMPNPTTTIFCRRLTSRSVTSLPVLFEFCP